MTHTTSRSLISALPCPVPTTSRRDTASSVFTTPRGRPSATVLATSCEISAPGSDRPRQDSGSALYHLERLPEEMLDSLSKC